MPTHAHAAPGAGAAGSEVGEDDTVPELRLPDAYLANGKPPVSKARGMGRGRASVRSRSYVLTDRTRACGWGPA